MLCSNTRSQVRLISISELEKRISNPDTLYLINFWATWCGPCVEELPNFDKLQRVYKDKPLKVLLVSMDFESELKTKVVPFVKSRKLLAPVYVAARKSDQDLIDEIDKDWSGALPATLLVNTKKGIHEFYEKEFTYDELNKIYQTNR
ncbi:MAG TPA: TlpA disulfide reductase family protein [Mucilaginibacter sp.]